MTKPVIIKREIKGTPLTYAELDANFQNLDDATINFTGDAGDTRSMDLNDTTSITGDRNMVITVDEATQNIEVKNNLSEFSLDPMGFENRTDSTFSFNSSTRELTIVASPSYNYWFQGIQHTVTTNKVATIPNTTDLYLVYFNDGSLLTTTGEVEWSTMVPVAHVYWNAALSTYLISDERHGISMDHKTKEYLHATQGAGFASGLEVSNYTTAGSGSLDADAQLDISSGVLYDQDLKIEITHSNTPASMTWEQDLSGPAKIPVIYHGSNGSWILDAATDFPVKQGTDRIKYNLNTAGVWSTPDANNVDYVAYWIVGTHFLNNPVISIMGQRTDNTLSSADTNNTWNSLDLTNFPADEFRPLYRLIFKTAAAYANTPSAYLAQIDDYRYIVTGGVAGGGGGVSGLSDIVYDLSPQLGGDLDVNGHSIVSASNGNISLVPNGSGNILLTPATGHVTISAINFPTGTGTTGQALTTDGSGNASWSTITAAMGGSLTSNLDLNGYNIISQSQSVLGSNASGNAFFYKKAFALANLALGATGTPAVLSTNGTGQSLSLTSGGTISLSPASNSDIQFITSGTGVVTSNSTISNTAAAGVAFLDRSASSASYANNATVNFSNFSGLIIINNTGTSGNVAIWICGGGAAVKLSDSISNTSGTVASNGGVNGYTWTNTTGATDTFSFAAVRTRAAG